MITRAVKSKIDRTAYAIALMEIGAYEWADGKAHYSKGEDGIRVYRVIKREAMKFGWDGKANSAKTYSWLFGKDGLYAELLATRLAHHRQRMSSGYKAELAKLTDDGDALKNLSAKLYETLIDDLEDPDRARQISFRDRAYLYDRITKMEATLKGDTSTRGAQPVITAHTVIGTLNLPDSVKDRALGVLTIDGEAHEHPEE